MRASALLLALTPLALAAHCGGAPFASGGGTDASTGGSSGSSSGVDASGSSSGGAADAPACTPDLQNHACDDCIANHCDGEWCDCVQTTGCETYVGCLLRGQSLATCASGCSCTAADRATGDKLIGCTTAHCGSECASVSSSSSSGGGSGSGSSSGSSSSSGGSSSSSSGGSSGSSSGTASSSSSGGSGSGGQVDAGMGCICAVCTGAMACCMAQTSPNCGKCCTADCSGTCL